MVFNNGSIRQILAAIAACTGAIVLGGAIGYSSPAIRSLLRDPYDDEIVTSKDQESWIGSLSPLGAVFGALIAAPLIEYLGPRRVLMWVSSIGFLGAFLIIGFSVNIAMMYVGRFIGGAVLGLTLVGESLYIVETSETKVRGMTGGFAQTFNCVGVLIAYGIGSAVEWNMLAWILCAFCAPAFIVMIFVPETPVWLMRNGRRDVAEKSLHWLRQTDEIEVEKELNSIQATIDKHAENQVTWRDLAKPYAFRPFLLSIGIMFFRQFCGINAVIYFNALIFEEAGSTLDPDMSAIIVAAIQVGGCISASLLVDRLGRRLLLLISFSIMGICVILLGIFFFWLEKRENVDLVEKTGWIPLMSLMLFVLGYSIGIGPLSWTVCSEIIPAEFKSICVAIANSFNWLMCFVVTEIFLPLCTAIGTYSTFWMFGAFSGLAVIYVFTCIPETKGKSAEEIRKLFDPDLQVNDHDEKPYSQSVSQTEKPYALSVSQMEKTYAHSISQKEKAGMA